MSATTVGTTTFTTGGGTGVTDGDKGDVVVSSAGAVWTLDAAALAERIDDRVAALLTAGANVTLTYDDTAGTLTIAASGGGGGSANVGAAVVDFGAFPGGTDASVAVTGQAGILAGSTVRAWLVPVATADHSADEHLIAATQIDVIAGNIVAGTGFTIYAVARHLGTEPLEPPGIGRRQVANATAGLNAGAAQGVAGSVGGADLSRQYGQYSIAWEWV